MYCTCKCINQYSTMQYYFLQCLKCAHVQNTSALMLWVRTFTATFDHYHKTDTHSVIFKIHATIIVLPYSPILYLHACTLKSPLSSASSVFSEVFSLTNAGGRKMSKSTTHLHKIASPLKEDQVTMIDVLITSVLFQEKHFKRFA